MSDWISVQDSLPDDQKKVLVYHEQTKRMESNFFSATYHKIFIGSYLNHWEIHTNTCGCCEEEANVTHWMPLPPSPKDVEQDCGETV